MFSVPKILIVDDEPRMCDSLRNLLSGQDYEVFTANSGYQAMDFLSKDTFDVVFVDMVMPDINGYQLMDHINTRVPDTFVIVITGHASVESAVEALRKGAYDYLKKPFEYDELLKTLQNALNQKKLKSENEILYGKLAMSEARYRYLVHNSPDIIYTLNEHGNFTFINSVVELLIGYKPDKLIGKHYSAIVYDEDLEKAKWYFNERRTGNRVASRIELRLKVCSDNDHFKHCEVKYITVELKSSGIYDKPPTEKDKKFIETHGVVRDISDRKRLELQLYHAQRMEALGTLAGGISHDFNNLLMGIQGRASLMLINKDSSHPDFEHLKGIEDHVQSAADLTGQLLAFARGGKYEERPTDLNKLVKNQNRMFGRAKKEITIHDKYEENLWVVEVDQGQIEQVLLNLYVNAWQSMPGGGNLYIQTENVIIDKNYTKPFEVKPGKYVKISVTDTGVGMDKATQQRIFEPFFTTREMGRGTGLGLASVYGIIKNHGGFIDVDSKKGEGATFNIYLPASAKEVISEVELSKGFLKGYENVLLVDDEDLVIEVGKPMLEEMGYEVLIARSGKDAIEIYKAKTDNIDIVILDMIMPEMGGGETYDKLKEINPNIKVLLASGYSIAGEATEILDRGCSGFIQKPFTMKDLSQKIRGILDKE